jgi:hypothetical protein
VILFAVRGSRFASSQSWADVPSGFANTELANSSGR